MNMDSRITNTKRNIIASYFLMVLQTGFSFVSKSVIIYTLGSEFLGLSSLFASILTVLNVAELGFTTSIVFFMYKPLSENDTERVCALLAYLKKVYRGVGIVILLLGTLAALILPKLVNGSIPDSINIYVLYFLYLINTALSYFLSAHKTALLTAIQRLDLIKFVSCIVTIIQYILQLVSLTVFRNFYLFILSMIFGTALTNLFANYISKKRYPQYRCCGLISEADRKNIFEKVKGLLVCNISIVTYSTLDNIVISSFVGLTAVAIYANYMTIYKAVNQLIVMIRAAMQSSVGNSIAKESIAKNLHDVFLWQFLFNVIATWCASCLFCLFQPFMSLWMGRDMLLPMLDVFLIVIWFTVDIVQQAHFLYSTGAGMWNDLKYSYIFNTCCNLLLNICLGKLFGVTGILFASLVTCIISGTFWQCIIIFKSYFKVSAKKYIVTQMLYFCCSGMIIAISYFIVRVIPDNGVVGFVIKSVTCGVVSALLILLVYYKNDYFTDAVKLLNKVIIKKNVV